MNAVFIDTVGMLALWDDTDQWHQEAEQAHAKFRADKTPVITTTYVLLECGNAAARRSFRRFVSQFRDVMIANGGLVVPNESDWIEAWDAYDKGEAGEAGIVDQISFAVIRRLGIRKAFTNDWHFTAAGFEVLF